MTVTPKFQQRVIKKILNSAVKWDILTKRSTVGMWQALTSTRELMYLIFNDVGEILVKEMKPKETVEDGVNLLEWTINYALDIETEVDKNILILKRCPFDKMRNEFFSHEEFKDVPYIWNCAYLFCRPVMLAVLKNLSKNLTVDVLKNRPTELMKGKTCDDCRFKVSKCEDENFAQAITCGNEFRMSICKKEIQCTYGLGLIHKDPQVKDTNPELKQDCPCFEKIDPDKNLIIFREREFYKELEDGHLPHYILEDPELREDPKKPCSDVTTFVM
ncbi:MAG: hypothetical protein ACTSX4_08895 [Candidatus Helarchaeota archaeon]